MILIVLFTFLIILVAICGDKLLEKTHYLAYKALSDTLTHGTIGLLSWVVIVLRNHYMTNLNFNIFFEIIFCGCLASLIDVDHFIAARSLNLKDATHLQRRPPFHSTTLLLLVFFAVFMTSKVFRSNQLCRLSWIFFTAGGSHHLRDGVRRGLWFPPFGSTPPLYHLIYLGSLAALPHIVAFFVPSLSMKKFQYVIV